MNFNFPLIDLHVSSSTSHLGPWLPGAVHSDLDGLVVGGHLHGLGHDGDRDGEALPPPAPPHESEVRELGELVLHDGGAVPDLAAPVVVIAALDADQGPVRNLLMIRDTFVNREAL